MKPVIGITSDLDDELFRLKRGYVSAIAAAGGLPLILPPFAVDAGDEAKRLAGIIDGLLLSGGGDLPPEYYGEKISVLPGCLKPVRKERIEFELALLGEVMKRKRPVLGICLGMQLINVALGGSLYQDIKLQVPGALDHKSGLHEVRVDQTFLSILGLQDPASAFTVNSFHHQAVRNIGDTLEACAVSTDGVVEGFRRRDYPFLLGVQWHPERSSCKTGEFLLNAGSCDTLSLKIFESFIHKCKMQDVKCKMQN